MVIDEAAVQLWLNLHSHFTCYMQLSKERDETFTFSLYMLDAVA